MALNFFRRELRQIFINLLQDQSGDPRRHLLSQHAESPRRRGDNQMLQGLFLRRMIKYLSDSCQKGDFVARVPIGLFNHAPRSAVRLKNSSRAFRAEVMSGRLILRQFLDQGEIRELSVAVILKKESFGAVAG